MKQSTQMKVGALLTAISNHPLNTVQPPFEAEAALLIQFTHNLINYWRVYHSTECKNVARTLVGGSLDWLLLGCGTATVVQQGLGLLSWSLICQIWLRSTLLHRRWSIVDRQRSLGFIVIGLFLKRRLFDLTLLLFDLRLLNLRLFDLRLE
ncbi:MAG TPA: hypothetical protein EYQ84_03410 [Nitrospinaceae bacterium]|nr:hypothetical protein [Nitrospinaceae bacterium]